MMKFSDHEGTVTTADTLTTTTTTTDLTPDELDAIEDLGDEIAVLAAHVHAATERLLALIARFDRLRGWELDGFRSCAHWLSYRTGYDLGTAREKVRAARALEALPETRAAMSRGELSFSQVRALTRAATPDNESELLEFASGSTTAELERLVRSWKKLERAAEPDPERARHETRFFTVFPDDEGMYVVRGKVDPEVGAVLMRAIDAAMDALFREQGKWETPAAQRRSDALGLLAERVLAVGFGGDAEEPIPVSGSRAERYQVLLHVDPGTLEEDGELGRSELEDGTRVSSRSALSARGAGSSALRGNGGWPLGSGETSRRLSCDTSVICVTNGRATDGSGESAPSLRLGRRTRTISPSLRRALEIRDRGCRFPGCGLRFTDGHHIRHWADGGGTSLENCILLCRHHHRLVHEGGWTVRWRSSDIPTFVDPRGGEHYSARPRTGRLPADLSADLPGGLAEALVRRNAELGVAPDWRTAGTKWNGV